MRFTRRDMMMIEYLRDYEVLELDSMSEYLGVSVKTLKNQLKELAEMLVKQFDKHPLRQKFPPFAGYKLVESGSFYGKGYQDVEHRKPSIRNAHRCLDWEPKIDMQETIDETLDFFLRTVDLTDKPS